MSKNEETCRLPVVYMAGKMVLRVDSGGDNKVPGKSYRPFDIMLDDYAYEPSTKLELRHLYGVPFIYSGPWQAMGAYHGLAHGITCCGDFEPRPVMQRAVHGIRACDIFFALVDGLDQPGTLAEIGIARGLDKFIVVGLPDCVWKYSPENTLARDWVECSTEKLYLCQTYDESHRASPDCDHESLAATLWFALEMADVRLTGYDAEGVLRQFSRIVDAVYRSSEKLSRKTFAEGLYLKTIT